MPQYQILATADGPLLDSLTICLETEMGNTVYKIKENLFIKGHLFFLLTSLLIKHDYHCSLTERRKLTKKLEPF